MHMLRNTSSPKLLVFFLLAIIPALVIALASLVWLGHETKTHAAPAHSMTQQGAPALPPAISQGVSVHGVPAWEYDGYRGSTIKIGIIDRDFQCGIPGKAAFSISLADSNYLSQQYQEPIPMGKPA